jgi:hypothetical protein
MKEAIDERGARGTWKQGGLLGCKGTFASESSDEKELHFVFIASPTVSILLSLYSSRYILFGLCECGPIFIIQGYFTGYFHQ